MEQVREENVEGNGTDLEGTLDQGFDKMPRRFQRRRPRQVVPDYVDWKDIEFLKRFIPERGKIMPRRISGVSAKDQRRIAKAIKRARTMALLPFVAD
jgi:small subunit ribosomal protein S18